MAATYTEHIDNPNRTVADRMTDLNAAVAAFDVTAFVRSTHIVNGTGNVVYLIEKP